MKRLLLLLPSNSYRGSAFITASNKLAADVVVGVDQSQASESFGNTGVVQFNFSDPIAGAQEITTFAENTPIDAIVAAEEDAVLLAAYAARASNLIHNSLESVQICRDKYLLRKALVGAGFPQPFFRLLDKRDDAIDVSSMKFPCVVKPTNLSASCGVIKADTVSQFKAAYSRVFNILCSFKMDTSRILVEGYIPGEEMALDGILENGILHTLALFDKPDPLAGPFFPETIYITPSRRPSSEQLRIQSTIASAAEAIGLAHGPIHAEVRIYDGEIYILEIAARSIGGRCGKTLRFIGGYTLEDLILNHALGVRGLSYQREPGAVGVMMIPVSEAGTLRAIDGLTPAREVKSVESVEITVPIGQKVMPLPEGRQYLGFIFAKASRAANVESALRNASDELRILIEPT